MGSTLHAKYGLKRVINASGRMSILGVSAPTDTVMEAMKTGGQNYVEIADLVDKSGERIAGQFGFESAVVVNSASSGIALSVAGIVTRGERGRSLRLHQSPIPKNEIVMLKGHNVQYGAPVETMVYLGGGTVVEAGYANEGTVRQIEEAVTERTAAILYVKSHHAVQKNMASIEETWNLAQRLGLPMVIDAAAEEDLQKYASCSDLVIFSGSKAIEGPTSGIVAGKREYIDWVKVQLHGIGRSMKVGKETTFGLLQALDEYLDKKDNSEREREALQTLIPLGELGGVDVSVVQDEAGRAIYRARVKIDPKLAGIDAVQTVDALKSGEIAIYTRDYGARQGYFDIDPRPLLGDDMQVIERRLRELLKGGQ
ncbi:DgaE family pyridoxal phosphate-dependent ammonia lyase [Saccharibacillus sp. CPCC 101409]|uniref:DgaE family pyridoxal phosphate-dependent ammonia lyase n=1 Tax=Saccharibacillus sp. CPCC 101409 TaxID=3058041 RepID=UPI0026740F91|nr:DgaE family pyridoxal phosphate-dependent ammonia lyase [Saccharibacillus sp. CPCC 101409]MDO3413163.1 DgaE family pyridoxal phosphate-dependent ammonia lyase [Saccharibacillus sp. CPCC 101409]